MNTQSTTPPAWLDELTSEFSRRIHNETRGPSGIQALLGEMIERLNHLKVASDTPRTQGVLERHPNDYFNESIVYLSRTLERELNKSNEMVNKLLDKAESKGMKTPDEIQKEPGTPMGVKAFKEANDALREQILDLYKTINAEKLKSAGLYDTVDSMIADGQGPDIPKQILQRELNQAVIDRDRIHKKYQAIVAAMFSARKALSSEAIAGDSSCGSQPQGQPSCDQEQKAEHPPGSSREKRMLDPLIRNPDLG